MKTNPYHIQIILLGFLCSSAYMGATQDFAESFKGTTSDNDNGYDISRAASGNIYLTGGFRTTVDFDPSSTTHNLTTGGATGTQPDIYVGKYTNSGAWVWAFNLGTTAGGDEGHGIAADASDNVYVTGFFAGTVDFDPSGTTHNLTATGSQDIYIAEYNSSGAWVWAKSFGSAGVVSKGLSIYTDASSNIYVTGQFAGTVNFGGGNITSNGSTDIFVVSFTSAGAYRWAFKVGTTGADYGIKLTGDGTNVYVTGLFAGSALTADFDPSGSTHNLTSAGGGSWNDMFLAAYTCAAGNYVWAFNIGGTASMVNEGDGVFTDGTYVYCTGEFKSPTGDFDPGPGVVNLTTTSTYFAKYSCATGAYQWAKSIGATQGYSILVENNILYLTGYFSGTVDFDPDAGTQNMTASGTTDMFITEYSPTDGSYLCKGSVGIASNISVGRALAGDAGSGHFFLTGWFQGTNVDFDPSSGSTLLTSGGMSDIFIVKYNQSSGAGCSVVLPVILTSTNMECSTGKAYIQWSTASEHSSAYFTIERSADGINFESIGTVNGAGNSNSTRTYSFVDSEPMAGTSFYRLRQTDYNGNTEVFNPASVSCNGPSGLSISLMPNPASEELIVDVKGSNSPTILIIRDVMGRVIQTSALIPNRRSSLNISPLPAGIYFVTTDSSSFTPLKFVKE